MKRARTAALAALAAVAALLLAALTAGPASAHDVLLSTDPADGSSVATAPATVTLHFDQPALAVGTVIRVTDGDGAVVSAGKARLVNSDVSQDLGGALRPGAYTVDWRVTSADGHPISGQFAFTAKGAGTGAESSPSPVTESTATAAGAPADAGSSGSGSGLLIGLGAAIVVLLALLGGVLIWSRRRSDTTI
jgi:copper resistance protein C